MSLVSGYDLLSLCVVCFTIDYAVIMRKSLLIKSSKNVKDVLAIMFLLGMFAYLFQTSVMFFYKLTLSFRM